MRRFLANLLPVLIVTAATVTAQVASPSKPSKSAFDMASVVKTLSNEEYAGRAEPEIEKSRVLIEGEFKRAGLEKIGTSYRYKFAHAGMRGFNLVGIKRSTHKDKLKGHVIVSAHYDHLGRRGGKVYAGACDNASGVAAMLRIAHSLKSSSIRRDIVFVAFDLEEKGLLGSYAYAERPPLPLKDCHFFVTMDMLGRKALGILDNLMFVAGWEWTPEVLPLLEDQAGGSKPELSYFWSDVGGDRSDFVAFKKKRVPHLYFSVGQNEDYHLPSDVFSKIDLKLLGRQADLVGTLVKRLTELKTPVYRQVPELNMIEFTSLKKMSKTVAQSTSKKVTPELRNQAMFLSSFADKVIRSGKVTSKDRSGLLRIFKTIKQSMR